MRSDSKERVLRMSARDPAQGCGSGRILRVMRAVSTPAVVGHFFS